MSLSPSLSFWLSVSVHPAAFPMYICSPLLFYLYLPPFRLFLRKLPFISSLLFSFFLSVFSFTPTISFLLSLRLHLLLSLFLCFLHFMFPVAFCLSLKQVKFPWRQFVLKTSMILSIPLRMWEWEFAAILWTRIKQTHKEIRNWTKCCFWASQRQLCFDYSILCFMFGFNRTT